MSTYDPDQEHVPPEPEPEPAEPGTMPEEEGVTAPEPGMLPEEPDIAVPEPEPRGTQGRSGSRAHAAVRALRTPRAPARSTSRRRHAERSIRLMLATSPLRNRPGYSSI